MKAGIPTNLKDKSYWQLEELQKDTLDKLPSETDVLIIGSGFTGVVAAMTAARGGRDVLVVDAQDIGLGASTRLAGYIGTYLHYSTEKLLKQFGEVHARQMLEESYQAHEMVLNIIREEKIDAGLLYRGRFSGARNPAAFDSMVKKARLVEKYVDYEYEVVSKADQSKYVGSDIFYGGVMTKTHGTLHPGKYHKGISRAAVSSGVNMLGNTEVQKIKKKGAGYLVSTSRGNIECRDVVIATNGYSNKSYGWLNKRMVSVPAHVIVTEELSPNLMKSLKPTGCAFYDSNRNLYWDRPSPDDKRLILGWRTGDPLDDKTKTAGEILGKAEEVYSQLRDVKVDYYWHGRAGFTMDRLPHIGIRPDGIHYAGGFNFSGLPMGTYFGSIIGQRLSGETRPSAFDEINFNAIPFYSGNPWFLPLAVKYYDVSDAWDNRKS